MAPIVPGKIPASNISDDVLDTRRRDLETYLKELIALKPIPLRVLEFIEFKCESSSPLRISILDDAQRSNAISIKIPSTDILIDEH